MIILIKHILGNAALNKQYCSSASNYAEEENVFLPKADIRPSCQSHPHNALVSRGTEAETSYDRIAPRLRSL